MSCPICHDRGMCAAPYGSYENGFWEPCPHCQPQASTRRPWYQRLWRWFLARHRLDLVLVCELSRARGSYDDYHDYPDSIEEFPDHFIPLTCKRCGKSFFI